MKEYFQFNARLGISIPSLQTDWADFPEETQHDILLYWENIRGSIPDRITDLERMINSKQAELNNESDFKRSCLLNSEIADLASVINDLWLWYRTQQDVTAKVHL
jgi:hypothetical protein